MFSKSSKQRSSLKQSATSTDSTRIPVTTTLSNNSTSTQQTTQSN